MTGRASRLLYVAAAPPVRSKIGPSRRNFHVIDQLSRFYDVTVPALGSPDHAARFAEAFGPVVDASCRVHGTANVYVAGSSVFPTGGWAPPTLTIVALAIRLADHLKARLAGAGGAG